MPPTRLVVDRRDSGKTVAAVLKTRLNLTWAQAKRLVEKHHVRYGGQVIGDPAHRVKAGKPISINAGAVENPAASGGRKPVVETPAKAKANPALPKTPPQKKPKAGLRPPLAAVASTATLPPALAGVILYSDDAVVVADKPAGLTTMRHADEAAEASRGRGHLTGTLAGQLPGLLGAPDKPVYAVHRIDRDTSGVVVFARTPAAAKHLTEQFRKHTVDRRYLALVRGTAAAGRIDSPIARDRGDGRRGQGDDGQSAVTFVKVVQQFAGFALVECRLETGRTHQVRIHLGEAGTPLCGETVYDRPADGPPLPDASSAARPMLHAAKLRFAHPETGRHMTWETPPPADFAALLAKLQSA